MKIDGIFVRIILVKMNTENEQIFLAFKTIIVRLDDQFIYFCSKKFLVIVWLTTEV